MVKPDWFQSVNYTIYKQALFLLDRSIGDYLRVAFPAAFGACIVIPLLVATAFMNSKDSNEGKAWSEEFKTILKCLVRKTDPGDFLVGPVLTVTAASPHEENGPILTSLPLVNGVDRLGTSFYRIKVAFNSFQHLLKVHFDGSCTCY